MSTYVIGDVQGCFESLESLLLRISYHPGNDMLWFTGDLVNRGKQSLEVLRFVRGLGDRQVAVLGNHDLHLLAVAHGVRTPHPNDTLAPILSAPDREILIDWLRHRPLLHWSPAFSCVMTHAGIAPMWGLDKAIALAREVEVALQAPDYHLFLQEMYGDCPDYWEDNLSGMARLRCIVNYLTRMRFCTETGRLNLTYKGRIADKPANLVPWFEVSDRVSIPANVLFGHWAALGGKVDQRGIFALDTGCVWGNALTALRLDDWQRFTVPCSASLGECVQA